MRPTTSSMLQQNNNNNYPCLNVSASTREMLQKCSRASLPFPSRMELGLGDLPLIRGLRAWALCSKNRRKAGSLLSGGQAPTTSPAGRGVLTSCTRPADVYLNREWGCMGYGLPLGLDARQAGIGSLVTVATLKTSEGSGKTQTQCVFLRTEKGSFLYSTAKPSSAVTAGAASSVVGGWLRAKTGVGRDIPAGRRENGLTPPAHIGVNRVRVRSGRRWRKSSNPAAREKTDVNRKRQQSGREDTAAAFPLEERQEERDKGGLAGKHSPRGEKEEAYTSPRCCHGAAPKSCIQCGKRAQRKESHNECDGGESPTRGASNRLNESHSGCDVEEIKKAESNEEERTRNPQDQESVKERKKIDHEEEEGRIKQTSAEIMPVRYESVSVSACASSISTSVSLEPSAPIEGKGCFADHVNCGVPTEQVNSREDHHQGHRQGAEEPGIVGIDKLVVSRLELGDENNTVNESTSGKAQCFIQNVLNPSQPEEKEASSSPQRDPSLFDKKARSVTGNKCDYCTTGLNRAERREELARQANVEENVLERVNPDKGDEPGAIRQRGGICCKLDKCDGKGDDGMQRHTADDRNDSRTREAMSNCAGKDECRSVEFVDDHRGTQKEVRDRCQQTRTPHVEANVTNVACADPSTTLAHSLANPAPTMPPLGSMATGLPCPEAVEEEEVEKEKEGFGVPVRDQKGGHEGNGRLGRQLEEQGSTVANEEERDKEETEEDEFGVFMQAEGEPAWSDEHAMSASVPCESRELVAFENHSIAGESAHGTPGWTDSSFHQSDNTWTAFSQDSSGDGSDGVAQWWPSSALENSRLSANQNLESVFEEAFPSPPCPSSDDPCDLHTVPTLSQLFRARASHDLGLLDGFHDLNKMICQRYRRANGVSRDLLLRSLHLEPPNAESRTAILAVNRHLSPGLLSANRHAQNAAAKRRLSYDHTKNVME